MATPFISEIKLMSFNYPPKGWALCNGQLLPINQNQALFSLLGTTYGGDGRTTFALPDLRGRTPVHQGSGFSLGGRQGEENHTLTIAEMPTHNHVVTGTSAAANVSICANAVPAAASNVYAPAANLVPVLPATISTVGASQPHNNMQPFLTLSFCIALQGIFPSQN